MRNDINIIFFIFLVGASAFAEAPLQVHFHDAVEKAATQSFESQRAKVDLLLQKTERSKTFAQMGPTFGFRYSDTTNDKEISVPVGGGNVPVQFLKSSQSTISLGVNLTATVAGLVKIWSDSSSVSASNKAKEFVETESAFRVAEIYRLSQQKKMAVKVAQSRLASAAKQQKNTEYLLAYGKINKADKLQVDFNLNSAELGLAQAQHEYQNATETLKKILDIPLEQEIDLDEMKDIKVEMLEESPEIQDAVLEALANRADLAEAAFSVETLNSSSWLNFASYLPLVQIDSNWQNNGQNVSAFSVQRSQNIVFKFSWQFWDNGAAILDFRKGQLQAQKAKIRWREKILDVKIDSQASMRNLELARKTLTARVRGLEQAEEAFRGFEARFALGAVSVADFLFAESVLYQARLDNLAAKVGLDIAYMRMQKSLGRNRPVPI